MTISYAFLIAFLILQVLTLYLIVCLVMDLARYTRENGVTQAKLRFITDRLPDLRRDNRIIGERLDDLTDAVRGMTDDIVFIGERLGFFDQATDPVETDPSKEERARCGENVRVAASDEELESGEKKEPAPVETFGGPSGAFAMKAACGVIPSIPDDTPDYPGTAPHVTFAEGGGHD